MLSCNVAEDFDENAEFHADVAQQDIIYGFSAADWFDVIVDVLNLEYGQEITANNASDTINFFVGNNCSSNRKPSTDSGILILIIIIMLSINVRLFKAFHWSVALLIAFIWQ